MDHTFRFLARATVGAAAVLAVVVTATVIALGEPRLLPWLALSGVGGFYARRRAVSAKVEGNVELGSRVGDGSGRDDVHAGLGDRPDGLEGHTA